MDLTSARTRACAEPAVRCEVRRGGKPTSSG